MKPNQTVSYLILVFLALILGMTACNDNDDDDNDATRAEGSFYDVWGFPSGEVFAVGAMPTGEYEPRGAVFQLEGTVWKEMLIPDDVVSLDAVWGFTATDVFAVGGYCSSLTEPTDCDSVIIHYDGTAWTKMEIPETLELLDLWGASPSAIWAVGGKCEKLEGIEDCQSIILRYDGETWSEDRLGEYEHPLNGIWGNSPANVYTVGNDQLLHFDGTSWTNIDVPDLEPLSESYQDVWGTGNDLYLFGSHIRHYDGSSWERIDLTVEGDWLLGAWGQSSSDFYAVGFLTRYVRGRGLDYEGSITRFDGESFEVNIKQDYTFMTGVWGRSSSDIYVCGSDGILHYDGADWSPMEFGD